MSPQEASKFLFVAIIIEICFVLIFLVGFMSSYQVHYLFNLDREWNIPALFSAAQLFLVGIVFLSMSNHEKQQLFPSTKFLIFLGIGFIFLSFDESFSIHERLTLFYRHIDWIPSFKGNHGVWVVPYLTICFIFLLLAYKNFIKLWNNYRQETTIMAFGFIIFLIGAVGLEVISYQFIRGGEASLNIYILEVALEEFMEMIGISIVLYGAILLRTKVY